MKTKKVYRELLPVNFFFVVFGFCGGIVNGVFINNHLY